MDFGNVLTAMVTPFDDEGRLDLKKTEKLVEYLIANGSEGLVLGGTTGESPTLSSEEKIQLFTAVKEMVNNRVPVLAGTGSNHTEAAVELTKQATKTGVDGIMLVTPYYNKPNEQGLYLHFKSIAESTSLPVMLYNVPGRSVVNMSVDTTVELSKISNIVSTKDASGDLDMMSEIIERTDDSFSLYVGDDSMTLPSLAVGSKGVVSVSAHVIGNEMKQMVDAFSLGHTAQAAQIHRKILPKMKACFMAPSPAPVKAALNYYGIDVGSVRLPLVDLSLEEFNTLKSVLDQ
ncbi:4-hydroxy-tetrahydrodipicolinate synthase [Alkalibacillus haloalkaliphilus]|uniref:4-hydroxy-tetrahydrodipicolinate synthase n=1 Tax=Alkalibacillus haloalkaliphilus TaxID=94136 RepID=UPI00293614C7|nr:4-hydroxy-tetrahydrodipicolinate synthase [Alkalibacillus haloalkaliphilus]MDV2580657.1 4-hydroxy-tetrahydrodipicolinate synthase [Alkalibacillus haloalkaliphilus]